MFSDAQFVANDDLDRQRAYLVIAGLAGAALGVDPGYIGTDAHRLGSLPGQHAVLSVTTGTAPQGQAAVTASIGGYSLTLPVLLVLAGGAWLLLRK